MFLRLTVNDFGTGVSEHLCETCMTTFTLCPALPPPRDVNFKSCLGTWCNSYDPNRDADKFFEPDSEVKVIQEDVKEFVVN